MKYCNYSLTFTLQLMSTISEQLEGEYAKAADTQTVVDLEDLGEKLSIETVATCTFGVKAGAFQSQEQSEFCKKAYGLFVAGSIREWRTLFAAENRAPAPASISSCTRI